MDTVDRVFGLKAPTVYKSIHKMAQVTNPDLLIGLELGIEQIHEGLEYYLEISKPAWTVVEDGSLRPRNRAWEFVSKPMPHGMAVQELRLLLGKLPLSQVNYSDRTSVHVHTNVQDFTQEQLGTLCLVYTCIEDVLFQFVNYTYVDKKLFPEGMSRDTNIYCVPWTQCRMNQKLIEKLIYNPGHAVQNWQKYTALNLIPIQEQGTVEWRHMHGTNNMEKLGTWLNIIGSIMQFAKNNTFEDVVKALKMLNDVSTYQQFFTSIVGDYIPYTDDYRGLLSDGCINAKYSLINWEVSKRAGVKMKPVAKKEKRNENAFRFLDEAIEDMQAAAVPQPAAQDGNAAAAVGALNWGFAQNVAAPQQVQPAPAMDAAAQIATAQRQFRVNLDGRRVAVPRPAPAPRGRF